MLFNVQVKPRLRENLKTSYNGEESIFGNFSQFKLLHMNVKLQIWD